MGLPQSGCKMFLILAIIILVVIFGVAGFTIHLLWWIAAILLVVWLFGFVTKSRKRWYKW